MYALGAVVAYVAWKTYQAKQASPDQGWESALGSAVSDLPIVGALLGAVDGAVTQPKTVNLAVIPPERTG